MTMVKICGLSKVEDALAAADAGADFLGIVFEPHSRRCVPLEDARRMVSAFREQWKGRAPRWVGVFANQPVEDVNRILHHCELDLAQLSGGESLEYCSNVEKPVLKVFHVKQDDPQDAVVAEVGGALSRYGESGHMCMLDTYKRGVLGGTGQVFDWDVARELAKFHPLLLAGGLTPENAADAIRQVRPWGLDVSSGVETDGQKDASKIAAFVAQVLRTDAALKEAFHNEA